jgi:polyhydroxyalkanoate synthesis regulator protein
MLNENDIYLPILCAQGENIFPIDMLKTIMKHFDEQQNPLVVTYDKKMVNRLKKQEKTKEKFKDLSIITEQKEKAETESESDTESEPEIISDDSDIEIKVNYQFSNKEDNEESSDDEKVVKKSSKNAKKSFSPKSRPNKSKSQIRQMSVAELKNVAKDMGIALTHNSKAKKKAELLDDILENM